MGMITVIITFIVPVLYIFGGIFFILRAPSYQCKGPAYKTKRAGLSPKTWQYANFNFGIVCIFMGIYLLILTALANAVLWRIGLRTFEATAYCIVAVLLQLVVVLLPFYNTEQHLKDYFDDEGRPLFEEKKHRFLKRKNEEEWEDWRDPPEEGEDGWVDWQTWLRKRDIELDREREKKEAEELLSKNRITDTDETDESFEEELEKLFEELQSIETVPDDTEEQKMMDTDEQESNDSSEESDHNVEPAATEEAEQT